MKFIFSFFFFLVVGISNAQSYNVSAVPYTDDSLTSRVLIPLGDDQFSGAIPIGFPFCFYGIGYDSLIVGSNGVVSFDLLWANNYCLWPISQAMPSNSEPTNAIFVPWQDLLLPSHGTISYQLSGVSPNRKFIIDFDSVAMYSCTYYFFSGQVKLFETSNVVEIHFAGKNICAWNGSYAIEGMQNATGTMADIVPGRNYPSVWTTVNDAWEFVPISNVCSGVGIGEQQTAEINLFVSDQNQITIIPNGQDYKMLAVYNMLGQEIEFAITENIISLKNTVPGIYIVNLEVNGMRVVKKVMMN